MSEEMIVKYCAPTLACIKTGSLFSCRFESEAELRLHVRDLNRRLSAKGLRVLPLKYSNGSGLIYVYRPDRLARDLRDETAGCLLRDCGYSCQNPTRCVAKLRDRLRRSGEFPHEIGLFLGYPPEDVHGFIHCKDQAKCSGLWKVYGDVEKAQRTFTWFKKCTDVYMRHWNKGRSLEKLTVSA